MRKDFLLTEKSNVILLKILKSALMVIVISALVVYFNHFSTDLLYLLVAVAFVDLISLLYLKSYKIVGQITFETNEILIEKNHQTMQLAFQSIRSIKLIIHGRKRRSYIPITYAPIGMNMADGTGNIIEIETEADKYKLDLFLKDSWDEKSLEFHIKRMADSGIIIEKRKLPAILGDSI
jgi:hypothetical protein